MAAKREELIQTIESIEARIWKLLCWQQQLMGRDDPKSCRMFERNKDELRRARRALAICKRKLATFKW